MRRAIHQPQKSLTTLKNELSYPNIGLTPTLIEQQWHLERPGTDGKERVTLIKFREVVRSVDIDAFSTLKKPILTKFLLVFYKLNPNTSFFMPVHSISLRNPS